MAAAAMPPPVSKDSLGVVIYSGVKQWIESHDVFKRLNPQAQMVSYPECQAGQSKFVVYVRGFTQLPASCYTSFCTFFRSTECDMLVKAGGVVELSVPYQAVAPPTPEEIRKRRGIFGFFDDMTQPIPLITILVALVFLFFTFLLVWYVTPEEKDRMYKGAVTWVVSWFYRLQLPPGAPVPPPPLPQVHGPNQPVPPGNGH